MFSGRQAFSLCLVGWGLLLAGTSASQAQDCNNNGIPDECDIDCGEPGGPCDVPDCGQSSDCNENSVPDECDIADGTSADCNENGVPDECEMGAGVPVFDGLTLWLRADSITGLMDGDPVSAWNDDSGTGFHVSQLDPSKQPTYVVDGTAGSPTLRFDGDDSLERQEVSGFDLTRQR